jgi:hypothetical protein
MDAENYGEPWEYYPTAQDDDWESTPDVFTEEGGPSLTVAEMNDHCFSRERAVEFARRIVACVNACRFIPTEQLEADDRVLISVVPK